MDPDLIGKTLGGGVALAVVVWLIYLGFRKDRIGIDAQTDATAIALLNEMREERREMREELGGVRERVAVLEEDKRRHADVLQRHALWDTRALALLQQADSSPAVAALGDPPPLYPQGG